MVQGDLVDAVHHTFEPAHVSVWLAPTGQHQATPLLAAAGTVPPDTRLRDLWPNSLLVAGSIDRAGCMTRNAGQGWYRALLSQITSPGTGAASGASPVATCWRWNFLGIVAIDTLQFDLPEQAAIVIIGIAAYARGFEFFMARRILAHNPRPR